MAGFWDGLGRPFFCLAPMENVTDTVFRQVLVAAGKPDVMFTEFVHVEAVAHDILHSLKYSERERPVVAQLWGTEPEKFELAARKVADLGFDGIDINMGCPVRDVIKTGACSALIGNWDQVKEIVLATQSAGLPVSVKTRLGIKKIMTEEWIGFLAGLGLSAITVHGRTVVEQSLVPAHWEEITKAVKVVGGRCLVIGNGDVNSIEQARSRVSESGVDGVMIGRGVFHNPFLFANKNGSREECGQMLRTHLKLWEETWGRTKNFAPMKKFIKMYVSGWEGAAEARAKLMSADNYDELSVLVDSYHL